MHWNVCIHAVEAEGHHWVSFPIIFLPFFWGQVSHWTSLSCLGRLASELSKAPISPSQSQDYRGWPPCLVFFFYNGAATQTQVIMLLQQAFLPTKPFPWTWIYICQWNIWGHTHVCKNPIILHSSVFPLFVTRGKSETNMVEILSPRTGHLNILKLFHFLYVGDLPAWMSVH